MSEKGRLEGLRVVSCRAMTDEEMHAEGWTTGRNRLSPVVIVFDDGTMVYASTDDEGNGPGALFGIDSDGAFRVTAE